MFELHRGERIGFAILLFLGVVLALMHLRGEAEIVWAAFIHDFVAYGLIMVAGMGLRVWGRLPRLSLTMVAVGYYPIYASLLALIGYMMFPLTRPLIDDHLIAIDRMLGYDWTVAVAWLAHYPDLSYLLKIVYVSSLPQLLILLLVLGALGRVQSLHRMIVTGMLAGIILFAFWGLWPSFGPSPYQDIPPEIAQAAGLLVTPEYGAQLMDLAQNGIGRIEKHQLLGTVGFPSFHILMAMLAVWFSRGTWLFWPYLVVNTLMMPATLTHGGHHLVDVPGGMVLFALAYGAACALLPQPGRQGYAWALPQLAGALPGLGAPRQRPAPRGEALITCAVSNDSR